MDGLPDLLLAPVFQAVQDVMEANRLVFNQADSLNANHGDHMVEVFSVAVQAANEKQAGGLAEAMDYASILLAARLENATAQVYAHGLAQLAVQLRKYDLTLADLVAYLRKTLNEDQSSDVDETPRSKDVLKALLAALAAWQNSETGAPIPTNPLDLGYMFDLGLAYLQAKTRSRSRLEVIADAAASVSPLSKVAHRFISGKLAILTLLRALSAAE